MTPVRTFYDVINIEEHKNMDYFLTVLGMVFIVEGLPYFTFPEKMKLLMGKIPQTPTHWLRTCGLFAMVSGLLLIYLAKRYCY
jgi:uncharacterized protein YjeT (DUF2065 family)